MALTAEEKENIMAQRGEPSTVMDSVKAFRIVFKTGQSTTMLSPNGMTIDKAIDTSVLKFGKDSIVSVTVA